MQQMCFVSIEDRWQPLRDAWPLRALAATAGGNEFKRRHCQPSASIKTAPKPLIKAKRHEKKLGEQCCTEPHIMGSFEASSREIIRKHSCKGGVVLSRPLLSALRQALAGWPFLVAAVTFSRACWVFTSVALLAAEEKPFSDCRLIVRLVHRST